MINRRDAEAAIARLCIGSTADTVTEAETTGAFRAMAGGAHPDHGGTAEAFSALTAAKQTLISWVKQQSNAATSDITDGLCKTCKGTGNIKIHRGFAAPMRRSCPSCRGTGDAHYDHDMTAGRD